MSSILFARSVSGLLTAGKLPGAGAAVAAHPIVFAALLAVDIFFLSKVAKNQLDQSETVKGPQIGDNEIPNLREGASLNRIYGPKGRVNGEVIWETRWREEKESESGGKGVGGGAQLVNFRYFKSFAVVFAVTRRDQPYFRFEKVLANSQPFFQEAPNVDEINEQNIEAVAGAPTRIGFAQFRQSLTLVSDTLAGGPDLSQLKSGAEVVISGFENTGTGHALSSGLTVATTTQPAASDDDNNTQTLSVTAAAALTGRLYVGDSIGIEGHSTTYYSLRQVDFDEDTQEILITPVLEGEATSGDDVLPVSTATRNNGTWTVDSSSVDELNDTSSATIIELYPSAGVNALPQDFAFAGRAEGDNINVRQEQAQFNASQVADIRFYLGSRNQPVDALITQFESGDLGAGNIPAFRDSVYMVAEDLQGTDFGNVIPTMQAILDTGNSNLVADAITEILLDAGFIEDEFDVTAVTSTFEGMVAAGPEPAKTTLGRLMVATLTLARQENDKLIFYDRSSAPVVDPSADVGAGLAGDSRPRPITVSFAGEHRKTRQVTVKFLDPDDDFQTAMKVSADSETTSTATEEIDLGVAITQDQAQKLADTLYGQFQVTSRQVTFQLPPTWLGDIREGYLCQLRNILSRDRDILVSRVEQGANFLLNIEGREEDLDLLDQSVSAGEGTQGLTVATGGSQNSPQANQPAGAATWILMDIPALRDDLLFTTGFFVATTMSDHRLNWRGSQLYMSRDQTSGYSLIKTMSDRAVIGRLVLPFNQTGQPYTIDTGSTVRVELINPETTLSSVTEDALLRGENRFLVGNEIIGAQTVTLVSTDLVTGRRTYDLTLLLRGQLDTSWAILQHNRNEAEEMVVWLDGPGIYHVPLAASTIGETRYFRMATQGGDPELVPIQEVELAGHCVAPFRVFQLTGTRATSNNITLDWERQSRRSIQFLDQATPVDQQEEEYVLRVLSAAGSSTSVRDVEVGSTRTYTYNTTDQGTDGFIAGNAISFEVVQRGDFLHEGLSEEITVPEA